MKEITCRDCGKQTMVARPKDQQYCNSCYLALSHLREKAYRDVYNAVRSGVLPRLDGTISCADCDKPASVYDHRSYLKPLSVDPVCHSCNRNRGCAEYRLVA